MKHAGCTTLPDAPQSAPINGLCTLWQTFALGRNDIWIFVAR